MCAIAACYPRAVKWLFSAAGAPLPATGVTVLNMRTETAANVVAGMMSAEPPVGDRAAEDAPAPAAGRDRWRAS